MNIESAVPTSATVTPHPLSGYQPNMMESSSPKTPWQFHTNAMKQEPMDQGNDSGVHFASPECNRSNNIPYSPPSTNQIHQSNFSTPITNQPSSNIYQPHIYNVSPLTPPNSDSMASSPGLQNTETFETVNNQQPFNGPNFLSNNPDASRLNPANNTDNPLRNLQMALENNELMPSSVISPKPSETSEEDENKSEFGDEYVDDSLKDSKAGKGRKKLRCKQCDFVGRTKMDMWEHSGAHIRVEKALPCTYCPFVTEYKHHLEYHLLNHAGAKPFKCSKCAYSCVNKSMLNSHMKSHSNIYQYRCSECSYATKYCHSLKLHLRKYQHKPAMVLNPDGTPNPLPIIDVYGTRRGPKAKLQQPPKPVEANPPQQQMPVPVPYPMFNPMQMGIPFPAFLFPALSGMLTNPVVLDRLQQLVNAQVNNIMAPEQNPVESLVSPQHEPEEPEALDLSKPSEKVQKNRRKGRAVKLTSIQNYEEETVAEFNNMEIADMTCHYCNIKFGDQSMYRKHMIFHGYNNPFACNLCGEECSDKYSFSDHIAQVSHK